ncbi:MAG: hypothetical protein A2Y17_13275 [Clostridiales bacterium GWF2_38_85]|nr:MAG: hypothetical protein A2Y17_13275 [Clostridiales bacterium GWF2_38_85]
MNYVKTCVYILITVMVLSLVLTYASIMSVIQTSRSNTERVLQSYVTENSTYIYNSIINGNDATPSLNQDFFSTRYLTDGTLDYDGAYLYNRDNKGGYVYRLTMPITTFTVSGTLNLTCSYTLKIPIDFAGKMVTELSIPIKVKTSYNLK